LTTTDPTRTHARRTRLARVGAIAAALAIGTGPGLVAAASASAATLPPVSHSWLDYYFNNKGIGSDASGDAPNLDGGKGFHRANLNAGGVESGGLVVGSEVAVPGDATLKYQTAGGTVGPYLDNIEAAGQTIDTSVALGSASAHAATKIAFVWTAHNASSIPASTSFTLTYQGGTTSTVQMAPADWCSDGNASNTKVAARKARYGDTATCTIFASSTVPLTGALDSITLPNEPKIHIFAIASDADTSHATASAGVDATVTLPSTVKVGDVVSPSVVWGSNVPQTVVATWAVDGAPLDASTHTQVLVPASWVGKHLTYGVRGSSPGYAPTGTTTSDAVLVEPGTLSATVAPALAGLARVGDTLVVSAGQYATADETPTAVGTSIAWLADGVVVPGQSGTTFVPTAAQVGKAIAARVTVAKEGYTSLVLTTTASAPVLAAGVSPFPTGPTGPTQPSPLVAISRAATVAGAARVGATLTAAPGAFSPAGATVTYQWLRGASVVPGATARTYRPTSKDLGAIVSVKVTASATGRQPVVQVVTAGVVQQGVVSAAKPKITAKKKAVKSGKVRVGTTLRAVPGTAKAPGSSVRRSYRWYANGKAVAGSAGKKTTLKVAKKYLGKRLTVRVTIKATGYTTKTVTSAKTGKVVR